MGVGQATERADFGCGETGVEVGDGFLAIALGLGRDTATAHQNQVGDVGRAAARSSRVFGRAAARPSRVCGYVGARPSQVDDFVAGGAVAGFKVKGFGAVETASKCDKYDFHPRFLVSSIPNLTQRRRERRVL